MKDIARSFTAIAIAVIVNAQSNEETTLKIVHCSTVSALSEGQRSKLAELNYNKCCTTGDFNVLVTGTDNYPDIHLQTACSVIAELLDQNRDGSIDNVHIAEGISFESSGLPPVMQGGLTEEEERAGDNLGDGENFAYAFSLQTWHAGDQRDPRPIIVEEVFHMMTQFGWGRAYPELFGSHDFTSSLMCREMARASCVHWRHPENTCHHPGTHEEPPLQGTCNDASCDCVEWFHQVALILGGIAPGWYGDLIPETTAKLRQTLSPEFLEVMDDPNYAMPTHPFTYEYFVHACEWTGCSWGDCHDEFGDRLPFEHSSNFCSWAWNEMCCNYPASLDTRVDLESTNDPSILEG